MRYRTVGDSGLLVSVVGLGCNNFATRLDVAATRRVVDAAIDAGITLLDTAEMYGMSGGSEEQMGEVLAGRRDKVVIATKFGHTRVLMDHGPATGSHGGRAYIRRAVEDSLRRLRTDHIDLYQLHTPDPRVPMAETLAVLHQLVIEGKVGYIGHSNLAGWQIAEAAHLAREMGVTPFISAQDEYSWLERGIEAEVIPAALHYGLGVLPYFPLANGLLTGKIRKGGTPAPGTRLAERPHLVADARMDVVERLIAWGEDAGRSILEIAIAGLAAKPGVSSVIAGATRPEQVLANAAAGDWEPTPAELAELDSLTAGADAG